MSRPGIGQLIAGAGGVLLIVSLFLPWVDLEGTSQSGWEFLTTLDVFLLIAAIAAIGSALTGGRIGLFRPDLSMNGATDLLGVVSTVLLAWLLIFDLPSGAGAEIGLILAIGGAFTIMCGAGDYSIFRRSPSSGPATADAPGRVN
jgi:hypothetical protein